jgi:hypothetical protein
MKKLVLIITILFSFHFLIVLGQENPVVLLGGTVLDITNYGNTKKDIFHSVVVFQNGKILYVGKKDKTKIPPSAKIIDVKGKYILPGLIDCFAILNSQHQANAFLFMGVTTVVGTLDNSFRGDNFLNANPSPRLERMHWIDQLYETQDTSYMEERPEDIEKVSGLIDNMDSVRNAGYTIAFLHHRFPAAMFDKVVKKSRELHMPTIGEMQYASYRQAMQMGVQAFVHTLRYSLEVYPSSLRDTFIHYPYKQGRYFEWYEDIENRKKDTALWNYAKDLAKSKTALIPTLAMSYAMLKEHENLWKEPAASILDSAEIHLPMNKETGKWTDDPSWWKSGAADHAMTGIYIKAGCHFLTGSGTDAFGSMPSISEHVEIAMLDKYGLTTRQAIAAATGNFSISFNWADRGVIEKGRLADILVLSGNPIKDLNNLKRIEMLFLNGVELNRSMLLIK